MEEKDKEIKEASDKQASAETVNDPVDDAVTEQKGIKKASNKKVITFTSICVIVVAIIILVFSLKGCTGCTASAIASTSTPTASASAKATASASPTPSATPTDTPEPTSEPEEATSDQPADNSGSDASTGNDQTYVAPATPAQPAQSNSNSGCTVVHHEATGHYETKVVSNAYDEQVVATPAQQVPYYVCSDGTTWNTGNEASNHIINDCGFKGNYTMATKTIPATYTTVHHDAVTNQVWVVDSNAYDSCE
jgi:cytoskeletal protein RodZ